MYFIFSICTYWCPSLAYSWFYLQTQASWSAGPCPLLSFSYPMSRSPFPALNFLPTCGPRQSLQPSYAGGVDVRPGLIDQTINYPCITSPLVAARRTSLPRPYREERRGVGWGVEQEGERVSGKLLIKYESILCHLSGHASTSPLRGGWERCVYGRGDREINKAY